MHVSVRHVESEDTAGRQPLQVQFDRLLGDQVNGDGIGTERIQDDRRVGRAGLRQLKARVADPDPESRVAISGEGRTVDGRVAAWQTRPLPDGATLVAFSDVTARRAHEALAERYDRLLAGEELKLGIVERN